MLCHSRILCWCFAFDKKYSVFFQGVTADLEKVGQPAEASKPFRANGIEPNRRPSQPTGLAHQESVPTKRTKTEVKENAPRAPQRTNSGGVVCPSLSWGGGFLEGYTRVGTQRDLRVNICWQFGGFTCVCMPPTGSFHIDCIHVVLVFSRRSQQGSRQALR